MSERRRMMTQKETKMWIVLGANTNGNLKTTNITMDRKIYAVGMIPATSADVTNWACSFQHKPVSNPTFNSSKGNRSNMIGGNGYIDSDSYGYVYIPCRGVVRAYNGNTMTEQVSITTYPNEQITLNNGQTQSVRVLRLNEDMYFTQIQYNVDPTKIFVLIDKKPEPTQLRNY